MPSQRLLALYPSGNLAGKQAQTRKVRRRAARKNNARQILLEASTMAGECCELINHMSGDGDCAGALTAARTVFALRITLVA
ncbi:putative proteasome-type protease [Paraburkholderia youngii]